MKKDFVVSSNQFHKSTVFDLRMQISDIRIEN
jgi:hypothetical protein